MYLYINYQIVGHTKTMQTLWPKLRYEKAYEKADKIKTPKKFGVFFNYHNDIISF